MIRSVAFLAILALGACADPASPTSPSRLAGADMNSAAAGFGNDTPSSAVANAAPPSSSAANYEVKFMTGMIDHHQMAVEMAEICLAKAVHIELRRLCERVIAVQTRELERMQAWLQNWYSISYSPEMSGSGERELARLASLSGADFEIAFMEMLIGHHEAAIREAQTCLERAAHRQLVRLCENIIRAQSAEIEQLEEWLCDWYGRCGTTN